jgi:DNA modification methylase
MYTENEYKNRIFNEDSLEGLKKLPDNCIDCCVTSPPYYALRDYGVDGQIGLEETPERYIDKLTDVFNEVKRVLKTDGTLWLNIGDSYWGGGWRNASFNEHSGDIQKGSKGTYCGETMPDLKGNNGVYKDKDLIGIPWMLAFSLRANGWYLRQDIIWCLSGGAHVYVKSQKGVMPMMIKDLVRLDPKTVQLWNGYKWVNVLGYGESNNTEEKIEIVLRSGERIGCTGGHKWVLSDNTEVLAKNLRIGNILKSCALPNQEEHKPSFFNKDLLWFLGLYLAEGSLLDDCIQISLNADEIAWVDRITSVATHLGGTCTHTVNGNNLNVRIYSQVLVAVLHQYIGGCNAKTKHINNICWQMPNDWLREIVVGYLDGDGHFDDENKRIRLGFTRNYNLERDLRVLASRLGATITIKPTFSYANGKKYPSFRGEWRWEHSNHYNAQERAEIVEMRKSRARHFYDIAVDSEDHLFSLASGILTHNCKPNPMPESVTDRCTKSHEYIFLMSKSQRYYFDYEAISEPCADQSRTNYQSGKISNGINKDRNDNDFGERSKTWKPRTKNCMDNGQKPNTMHLRREAGLSDKQYAVRNKRDVWSVNVKPDTVAHFATYPEELIKPCILAGSRRDGYVLDPFMGSGTTAMVARKLNRNFVGFELNRDYIKICEEKIKVTPDLFY